MGGSKVHRRFVAGSKVNLIHRVFKLHISPPSPFVLLYKNEHKNPSFATVAFAAARPGTIPKGVES
jgi:hypothetical protein